MNLLHYRCAIPRCLDRIHAVQMPCPAIRYSQSKVGNANRKTVYFGDHQKPIALGARLTLANPSGDQTIQTSSHRMISPVLRWLLPLKYSLRQRAQEPNLQPFFALEAGFEPTLNG